MFFFYPQEVIFNGTNKFPVLKIMKTHLRNLRCERKLATYFLLTAQYIIYWPL